MAVDQYKIGYDDFRKDGELPPEMVKSQHPLWRAGYRAALIDHQKKHNLLIPLELYEVPRKTKPYVPTYGDIMGATKHVKYSKLHRDFMYPLLSLIIKSVENKKDQIKSYAEVREYVDTAFNIILQYGYDCAILNLKDLNQYHYIPK